MQKIEILQTLLQQKLASNVMSCVLANSEATIEIEAESLLTVMQRLRDDNELEFTCLMDVCVVDYLDYGVANWQTQRASTTGFDRGVETLDECPSSAEGKLRFAVVYHLLSINKNWRVRVRTFAKGEPPSVDSVISIWQSANWYEREAFDLFGVFFRGHPDLRRILTDYGFVGHPMCKDFPTSGRVEVRFDYAQGKVIYQPVSIEPRTLVPRVIRDDSRRHLKQPV